MAMCGDDYGSPNVVGQPEQVSPQPSTQGTGPVGNTFLDYLRGISRLNSPGGQAGMQAQNGYHPSPTENNLGKAAGAASQAGLCGGGGAAAGAL